MKFLKLLFGLFRPKITRLVLNESDFLVVTYAQRLSVNQHNKITEELESIFGGKIKILVLDSNAQLSTVSYSGGTSESYKVDFNSDVNFNPQSI